MEFRTNIHVSSSKRITINTLIMYIRMLVVTFISFYTVRITLNTLGIEDYGIYNVIAGIVTLLSFISTSMQTGTLRFYSYAIGENDSVKQNIIFNTNILIYIIIVFLVIIFAETVGLWFINYKIVIPDSRVNIALWVYQFSVLSFVITLLASPFSSMIIAHENMGIYSLISLADCILKFLILFPIMIISYDKLFIYGFFMLCAVLIKESIGIIYCKKKYKECYFHLCWNKELFKTILSYSGWTLFGTVAGVANNQGNNILINMFFGPLANAARAVAFQVSNAMTMFSTNFLIVLRPPLIKSYAKNDHIYMLRLFYLSSKLSYYLVFVLFLPLILETEYVLNLWLSNVTDYMVIFTRLTLISVLILSMNPPITTIIQAVGAVKKYHLIVEPVILLSLPITYLFFKFNYAVESTFYISIFIYVIAHILRVLVLHSVIKFSIKKYIKEFIYPISMITVISGAISVYASSFFQYGFVRFIIAGLVSALTVSLCFFLFGLNKNEKKYLLKTIKMKKK